MLGKTEQLLIGKMEKNQSLTNEHEPLLSKFEDLSTRHEALSADLEKLTFEFLKRKQELEKLKASHDDPRIENDYLLAQQISANQEEFVPPYLKCIEYESAKSSPESSTASMNSFSNA